CGMRCFIASQLARAALKEGLLRSASDTTVSSESVSARGWAGAGSTAGAAPRVGAIASLTNLKILILMDDTGLSYQFGENAPPPQITGRSAGQGVRSGSFVD